MAVVTFLFVFPELARTQGFVYPVGHSNQRPTDENGNANGYKITQEFHNDRAHTGVDLANGAEGGEVRAIGVGVVWLRRSTAESKGWGNIVLIRHDLPEGTFYSLYGHMQEGSVLVAENQSVIPGTPIGKVDCTGNSEGVTPCPSNNGTGSHLHFGVRRIGSLGCGYIDSKCKNDSFDNYVDDPLQFISDHSALSCSFGTSQTTQPHPNGTLVKLKQEDDPEGKVYLLQGGQRRWITTPDVLYNLYNQANGGFDFSDVITISAAEMNSYGAPGPPIAATLDGNGKSQPDGRLIKARGGTEVSIVTDGGKRRAFTHESVFLNMGYTFCKVIEVDDYNSYTAETPITFFDGSNDPRFQNNYGQPINFGQPAIDSQGRLILVSVYTSIGCGFGYCGNRLNSINPNGTLNWQSSQGIFGDGPYISNDGWASNFLALGPGDNIFLQGERNGLFGYNSSGNLLSGWPVSVYPTDKKNESDWGYVSFQGLHLIGSDGTIYVRSGVTFDWSYQFPNVVVAINPDGSEKWRRDYPHAGGGNKIVFGPARDIYTVVANRFIAIDHGFGTEFCTAPINMFAGSLVGGLEGVFSSYYEGITAYDANCNFSLIYSDANRYAELRDYAGGTVFGIDYPIVYDPNQIRLMAVSKDGSNVWMNSPQILVPRGGEPNPIRVIKNGILYVIGQDLTDGNKDKLFLVDAALGGILNSIETTNLCGQSCGVAVADDGTIYLSDLSSTKIWKVK
jgi:murein DD-endopeptidase MepM/ murein hydrolase activator NlpD